MSGTGKVGGVADDAAADPLDLRVIIAGLGALAAAAAAGVAAIGVAANMLASGFPLGDFLVLGLCAADPLPVAGDCKKSRNSNEDEGDAMMSPSMAFVVVCVGECPWRALVRGEWLTLSASPRGVASTGGPSLSAASKLSRVPAGVVKPAPDDDETSRSVWAKSKCWERRERVELAPAALPPVRLALRF